MSGRAAKKPTLVAVWPNVIAYWNDPSYRVSAMKPSAPFGKTRSSSPLTDYFFHAGLENWRGYSSPFDGDEEDRSEVRRFHAFSREFLLESARERAREMVVFAFVVVASAWPVIYMVVT
jgi:hypothetical protein